MPVEAICASESLKLINAAQKIVGSNVEAISQNAQIVKGRLTGTGFKMGNR